MTDVASMMSSTTRQEMPRSEALNSLVVVQILMTLILSNGDGWPMLRPKEQMSLD
jgi:hypothetical protein